LDFICKRCNQKVHERTQRELVCTSCNENLDLLEKQLDVNANRIKKLEEHKKLAVQELKNPKAGDRERIAETLRRLDHNLQIEYNQHRGIVKAMNSKDMF